MFGPNNMRNFYIFITLISLLLIIKTSKSNYDIDHLAKHILVIIAFFIYLLNIYINNNLINKYLLPFLLFLNIAILIIKILN